ncbi:hypothetical protein EDC04DRAFT_2902912 [Pisolithus marmoratus]|nr:hypothetical protein EDC04DRAFT_2902912 [Pisolithus marmoratus]
MPLELLPPQSPHGKNSSPPNTSAQQLNHAQYDSQIFVLTYYASTSSTWTWTTKDGPNKGKSFQVPTIPITCDKSAPKAICWIVAVFHLFKAHLNPVATDSANRRVLPGWL